VAAEELASEQLAKRICEALQEGPLYRTLHYKSDDDVRNPPRELRLFCDHANCGFVTTWAWTITYSATKRPAVRPGGFVNTDYDGFFRARYLCNNCRQKVTNFFFFWQVTNGEGWFIKVGQYPELEERVSVALTARLNAADLKTFKNGLRTRNFGFGLASVAYMRRLVENRMNDILQVLYETAKNHNVPAEVLARHEEVMADIRFSVKIEYAGQLLPASLRPKGKGNPMAVLHSLFSEGLHAKSDAECVEIFDACRKTFEYVFEKMEIENEQAREFVNGMAELHQRKAKLAQPEPAGSKPQGA